MKNGKIPKEQESFACPLNSRLLLNVAIVSNLLPTLVHHKNRISTCDQLTHGHENSRNPRPCNHESDHAKDEEDDGNPGGS